MSDINFYLGLGNAVAERTILRRRADGNWETWADVTHRVALGNSNLARTEQERAAEYEVMRRLMGKGVMLMAGRHLQHGDETQATRNMEIFTNCSTSATSFMMFYLLLNGSGVGRCYDDDFLLVNYDYAPKLCTVIDERHPDYNPLLHESVREARHRYGDSKDALWFQVPDSREGWAQALEIWETAAFEKVHKDKLLVLDFSLVRPRGRPIMGLQGKPASGPAPLMHAFQMAGSIKGMGIPKWRQAMLIDHYFAACVVLGGARRSSRMATKIWRDRSVLDFIQIKRPIEFKGLSPEQIDEYVAQHGQPLGFLWTSNNSVVVDEQFWNLIELGKSHPSYDKPLARHARRVFNLLTKCAWGDGTGEPGIINGHRLVRNDEGMDTGADSWADGGLYRVRDESRLYLARLHSKAQKLTIPMITNPCGEIPLHVLGGYCVLGDVAPYFADTLDEFEEAVRATVRALIRVNTLPAVYQHEVRRTNRIGVSLTGIHEFAYKYFQLTFEDLLDFNKSDKFWQALSRMSQAATEEADTYSAQLGLSKPHTLLTVKPSGSVSKLFGISEGWHLPAQAFYLRWVQFRAGDPLIEEYKLKGYPVRKLETYNDTYIIGFPTAPRIAEIMPAELITTSAMASMADHFHWLLLGELFWIRTSKQFFDEGGADYEPAQVDRGGQISYTIKYDKATLPLRKFREEIRLWQPDIKVASILPLTDQSAYEYLPEEPISAERYQELLAHIQDLEAAAIDIATLNCESGACPVDIRSDADMLQISAKV